MSEWGNLTWVVLGYHHLNVYRVVGGTRGSETSQSTYATLTLYDQPSQTVRLLASYGERKRRRLNQMRVRGGGRCVFGVVGPCWILLPGDRASCCWELNSLGSLTVERESRVSGPVASGVGVVPE